LPPVGGANLSELIPFDGDWVGRELRPDGPLVSRDSVVGVGVIPAEGDPLGMVRTTIPRLVASPREPGRVMMIGAGEDGVVPLGLAMLPS
jgi:hypothetical protein